ncbi:MAG: hypothetical protein CBC02_003960 [Flavobacteriaceae bacterium TMED42]|nr:MAG: hypothetical protein CBC02_003960 [Flavobacteriaceae bacterium TMED42]
MKYNKIFIVFYFFMSLPILAQEEEKDDLGTQEVTVVRSYNPSLKSVFKIRTNPEIDDSLVQKKIKVDYTFEPVPVVSTFVPNKATPLKLQRRESSFFHNSYVMGGLGNQSSSQFNFSTMVPLDRMQSIGLGFLYNKVGPIDKTVLNSYQKRTSFNLLHQYKHNNMRVDSDLRFDRQGHNFFGQYDDLDWTNISSFRPDVIDPSQNLNYLSIRSRWQWYDGLFNKVNFNTHITTDSFDSSEHIVKINTQMRIPFFNQYLELIPHIELINTNFVRGYYDEQALSYSKGMGRLEFQFLNIGRKLKLRLGAKGIYPFGDAEEDDPAFFVYPKAEISYKSGSGKLVPFLNYNGGYDLNSFTSFSLENPYVAPTLAIKATEVNHYGDLGLKAYPGSGLSLKFNAHYSQSDNFPLFKRLPYDDNNQDVAYRLSNAYEVVYDSVEKMGIVTQIEMRFSEYNKISLETGYYEYKRKGDQKVWNLPSLKIDLNANFRLGKKIFFQASGHYIGDRDSVKNIPVSLIENSSGNYQTIESVGSVFSIASSITWKINDQWDLFYEGNMILSDNTSRWAYYQNQSQLHLGGIRYKFDINL